VSELTQLPEQVVTEAPTLSSQIQAQIQAQVATLLESLVALPPGRLSINAHLNLAQLLLEMEDRKQEIAQTDAIPQLLTTALQQAQALGDRRAESSVLGTWGHWYEQTGAWATAQEKTERAAWLAENIQADAARQ